LIVKVLPVVASYGPPAGVFKAMAFHWSSLVVRPVGSADLDAVLHLSASGGRTLTTLPEDREFLDKRIKRSVHAFYPEVSEPGNETYTFVLEHVPSGEILGISAINARTGGFDPFYTYERVRVRNDYEPLGIHQQIERLECHTWHKGPSELGSLYLLPGARGTGVGKLLSLARLLFMGAFPQRFEESVIAEIRGWQDAEGISPFWKGVIEPFFGHGFAKMDAVSGSGDKAFIGALLPKHPIYCALLPAPVYETIGKAHPEAEPAMRMLMDQGFEETNYVDVFDAGPMIKAHLGDLPTTRLPIQVKELKQVSSDETQPKRPTGICFSRSLDFAAALVGQAPDESGVLGVTPEQYQSMTGNTPSDLAYFPLS
jgi:arginine N-succinyltransferase